jgi:hypothetical protein
MYDHTEKQLLVQLATLAARGDLEAGAKLTKVLRSRYGDLGPIIESGVLQEARNAVAKEKPPLL